MKLNTDKQALSLALLPVNAKAIVLSITENDPMLRQKLLDMGLISGTSVKLVNTAPLNDPVNLELRGYQLCIRKHEIKNVLVKVIS